MAPYRESESLWCKDGRVHVGYLSVRKLDRPDVTFGADDLQNDHHYIACSNENSE